MLLRCLARNSRGSELFEGEVEGKIVVVKRFYGIQAKAIRVYAKPNLCLAGSKVFLAQRFMRELKIWRTIW